MNVKYRNKIKYYYEGFWRQNIDDNIRDSEGNQYPWPRAEKYKWSDEQQFIKKLNGVQNYLKTKELYDRYEKNEINPNCLLCDKKNILNGVFNLNNTFWRDDLIHYIEVHNIILDEKFVDMIYKFMPIKKIKRTIKYESDIYEQDNMKYLKLETNQLMIIDALMRHGGYTKKYNDKKQKDVYRYSEHAGLLDFNDNGLDKIIISGKTSRIDKGDEEIYLPKDMPYALDYEYVFHTHPPTPKAGGRATQGILYEFPSVSDIYHFIDNYNHGTTQGSLVITPEGLYNIRKLIMDRKKIKIDEDELYKELSIEMRKSQHDAIKLYGTDFTTYEFYSKIAQNTDYIKNINTVLNKYKINIDFYPRQKDLRGNWIISSIHLPIFVTESIRQTNR